MDGTEVLRAVYDRLLCLAAVGYVWLMMMAALTVFQRLCWTWIVLHTQSARTYLASAVSCRERANNWTEWSMAEPDERRRAEFATRAAWFASRAEAYHAQAERHEREVVCYRFLQ
jgi:hypothetical protein